MSSLRRELEEGDPADPLRCRVRMIRIVKLASPRSEASRRVIPGQGNFLSQGRPGIALRRALMTPRFPRWLSTASLTPSCVSSFDSFPDADARSNIVIFVPPLWNNLRSRLDTGRVWNCTMRRVNDNNGGASTLTMEKTKRTKA